MHIDPIDPIDPPSPLQRPGDDAGDPPRVKTKTSLDYIRRPPSRSNNAAARAKSGTRGALRATEALWRAAAVVKATTSLAFATATEQPRDGSQRGAARLF